ncbi:MAG: hypothetical protein P8X91_04440 [Candidatus Bathyarchaeota archaeon]
MNPVLEYLRNKLTLNRELEAWYIVSKKLRYLDEEDIIRIFNCKIIVMSKIEFINRVVRKVDPFLAAELKPIIRD